MLIVRHFRLSFVSLLGMLISYLPLLPMAIAHQSVAYLYTKSTLTTFPGETECARRSNRTIFDSGALSAAECLSICQSYPVTCAGAAYNTVEKKCKGYGDANNGVFCSQDVAITYYIKANTYAGCHICRNHGNPRGISSIMTHTLCCNQCKTDDSNNVYFATRNEGECYCVLSSSRNNYKPVSESYCGFPCSGDNSQICGGRSGFSLYHIAGVC